MTEQQQRDKGRENSGADESRESSRRIFCHTELDRLIPLRKGAWTACTGHRCIGSVDQQGCAPKAIVKSKGASLEEQECLAKHRTIFRVRYAETDQMGVVYHANYLVWMEIGRVELVRSRGFNYKDLEAAEGIALGVVEASCRYHFPARYDQEIVVETEVISSSSRMIEFAYRILLAGTERLLASGSTRHIWLNRDMRPARLPMKYHAVLRVG